MGGRRLHSENEEGRCKVHIRRGRAVAVVEKGGVQGSYDIHIYIYVYIHTYRGVGAGS